MNMEFLEYNLFQTTTMCTISSGTATVGYMIDRDSTTQYVTSGDNSDLTTSSIRIEFTVSDYISRIVLENINWKSFKIYYNSNTANTFTLTNALTTTTNWASNSETSLYLMFPTTSISILTIDVTATMVANEEKKIGELWICNKYFTLENNPSAKNYKPLDDNKQYTHEMSDGGVTVYKIANSFNASIMLDYISLTERANIRNLYDILTPFIFIPEPTGTGWAGEIYEVNWIGDYGFKKFTDNFKGLGFTGEIKMRETPK